MTGSRAGFEEIEHTADWELHLWAPDLPGLLEQAARGMYALAGMRISKNEEARVFRTLDIFAADPESLLVRFLSELLHIGAEENLGFDGYRLSIDDDRLQAELSGGPILAWDKEIKAVTYHDLLIRATVRGVEASIVLDV
jgi:SHS2 domain-containing protein